MEELKNKRILVQGAGRGNLGLVKAAIRNGVRTVVTGLGGNYPCTGLADHNCIADISKPDEVLKAAMEYKVDGAIICCSDTGLRAVGRCNDRMGLTGISEESAILSSDKFLMKEKLVEAGVRTAKFFKVCNENQVLEAADAIGYPVILKAVDLQGSRGIFIIREQDRLIPSFKELFSMTRKDYCIIEEYLVGEEFGAQSFVFDGEVLFVLPHGDETVMCRTAVPTGHFMPRPMSEELVRDTEMQVRGAIRAIGLNNCAVNVDLIERDGKVYVIELSGRVGANCLPELTGNYFGIDYYEMILATALGCSPLPYFNRRKEPCATLARMIRSDRAGIVEKISVPEMKDTEIHMFIDKGSEIRVFTNCNDAIGEIIVKGNSLEECRDMMEEVMKRIKIELS